MNTTIITMIIGMAVVTYVPRMLPFVLFRGRQLPDFLQGILRNVPYATLGALIFPGVLVIQEDIWFGLIGAAAAFLIAFTGVNIIFCVIGSIAVLSLYSLI
ncbi:branched-subunit amino acid transport protein [Bacillus ectoiniformans]|uniref:AzlD domain-containing protein n=1 Tax=Bacillus ectoiniformans TaxID=1494429 RepID=UPI0019578374|nr:AzlD domain-containing protein [Bacillus ectoiniformans]MBM7647589.1 branched-subunit amino acid transport protein [Bacillus ectoiniformans]